MLTFKPYPALHLKPDASVMRNNALDIFPALAAPEHSNDADVLPLHKIPDKAGLGRTGIAGLAVNFLFPVKKQDLVMAFQLKCPASQRFDRLVLDFDR